MQIIFLTFFKILIRFSVVYTFLQHISLPYSVYFDFLPLILYKLWMIYIYDDGVHNHTSVLLAVQEVMPDVQSRMCTTSMIMNGCLDQAALLIMPGGADLYYSEKLNGRGNDLIKKFVEDGGAYLGICAGAYYASRHLDWNNGEIAGSRELDLFEGTTFGPVSGWVEKPHNLYDGSWIKAVSIKDKHGRSFKTFYNGGPLFEKITTYSVLGQYTDLEGSPPAIIEGRSGKGRFVLASPHIELFGQRVYDRLYKHRNSSYDREYKEISKLEPDTDQQRDFFQFILRKLIN